jgi:hypothetical protein
LTSQLKKVEIHLSTVPDGELGLYSSIAPINKEDILMQTLNGSEHGILSRTSIKRSFFKAIDRKSSGALRHFDEEAQ